MHRSPDLEAGGKTSTFYQGEPATPAAQNPAKSSDCKAMPSLGGKAYGELLFFYLCCFAGD